MLRPPPRQHGDQVETQRQSGMIGLALQPEIGCGFDTVHGLRRDGQLRSFEAVPRLDLDDEHQIAAPGDQVDLAKPCAITPRDDRKPLRRSTTEAKRSALCPRKKAVRFFSRRSVMADPISVA